MPEQGFLASLFDVEFKSLITTKVIKAGSKFKGDIHQIVLVDQDGNYGNAPGKEGKGTVAGLQCPVN